MEIIITILWIAYGLFSAYQAEIQDDIALTIAAIVFSPLVLVWRILYGVVSPDVF